MKALLLSVPVLLFAAFSSADDAKPDQEQIQGIWKVVSFEEKGGQVSEEDRQKAAITFKDDKLSVKQPNGEIGELQFSLDPSTNPKSIDLLHLEGNEKGQTTKGIYTLEDGKLTICVGRAGEDRPTEFRAGEKVILGVFERAE